LTGFPRAIFSAPGQFPGLEARRNPQAMQKSQSIRSFFFGSRILHPKKKHLTNQSQRPGGQLRTPPETKKQDRRPASHAAKKKKKQVKSSIGRLNNFKKSKKKSSHLKVFTRNRIKAHIA